MQQFAASFHRAGKIFRHVVDRSRYRQVKIVKELLKS